MDHLAGEATGIAISPVVKLTDVTFGGSSANYVDGWEIPLQHARRFVRVSRAHHPEAVEDAWANSKTWRGGP
jgi:hypothetical protein